MDTIPNVGSLEEKIKALEDTAIVSKDDFISATRDILDTWYTEQNILAEELRNHSIVLYDNTTSKKVVARTFNINCNNSNITPRSFKQIGSGKASEIYSMFNSFYENQSFGERISTHKRLIEFLQRGHIIIGRKQVRPIVKISPELAEKSFKFITNLAGYGVYGGYK